MKLSLARISLIAFLMLEFVLSASILAAYQTTVTRQYTPSNSDSETLAVKARVLELSESLRSMAAHIASHPKTLGSLTTDSEAERSAHIANIRSFFPDAQVKLQPLSSENASMSAAAYASSVVHARLFEETAKVTGAASGHLTLTTTLPVTDHTNTLRGFVIIDKDFPELGRILKTIPANDAYVELQQTGSGGIYAVLAQHGNETLKIASPKTILDLPNTAWRLAIWPAPTSGLLQNYVLAWLSASMVIALIIGAFYFVLRRTLHNDLRAILTLFTDIRHNRLRKDYAVRLKETKQIFNMMYELGKLMIGKQKRVASDATLDHLSQVNNRRSFEAKQQELFKTLAQGWVHSLLILDIDNFKQVNDTFGHDAGDALIVQFGKILKDNLRSSDFIARLGGDEFCVIFPNTPLKRAAELESRLRSNMPRQIELASGVLHRLSWSGGLSEYNRKDTKENQALSRADAALLEAKQAGRSRTSLRAAA
jgi:diguanylate cyclase (GGDEF)-like protein